MVVVYLTNPKLLFLPTYSKSRLLAVLSCPQFIPIHLTLSRPCSATRYKKLIRSVRSTSAADDPNESSGGRTRLIRTIQSFQLKLSARLRELTKDLPVKLFSFLVGFYCATAFATVIGQTGDWDVLSAALTVAVVEGIGALMYKASLHLFMPWMFGTIYPKSNIKEKIDSLGWRMQPGLFKDFRYLDYRMSNSFVKQRILLPAS